jgi:hypothetical protein
VFVGMSNDCKELRRKRLRRDLFFRACVRPDNAQSPSSRRIEVGLPPFDRHRVRLDAVDSASRPRDRRHRQREQWSG